MVEWEIQCRFICYSAWFLAFGVVGIEGRWTNYLGLPGMLKSLGSQRVGHDLTYEKLNWRLSNLFQFSSVASDSATHELQHASPPCPTPTLGAYPNLFPLSRWCIQPSHPLSSPSPPTFNLSQHQGLFQWVSSSHQVARLLELQLQHQTFQWVFRVDFL